MSESQSAWSKAEPAEPSEPVPHAGPVTDDDGAKILATQFNERFIVGLADGSEAVITHDGEVIAAEDIKTVLTAASLCGVALHEIRA